MSEEIKKKPPAHEVISKWIVVLLESIATSNQLLDVGAAYETIRENRRTITILFEVLIRMHVPAHEVEKIKAKIGDQELLKKACRAINKYCRHDRSGGKGFKLAFQDYLEKISE